MADAQIAIIDGDPTQIAVIDGDQTQIVMAPGENPAIVTAIPGPQGPAGAVAAAIDGSAALPSIAFASDTDTGLYRVGANQLGVSTGGTQRLVIDASGQIEATSLGSAASPTWTFVGDPDTGVFSPGANQIALSTNGTGRLFVNASGDVNISGRLTSSRFNTAFENNANAGTNIPLVPLSGGYSLVNLDNAGAGTNATFLRLGNVGFSPNASASWVGAYYNLNYSSNVVIYSGKKGNFTLAANNSARNAEFAQDVIIFSTGPAGTADTSERLRITSAGLVGIGTSTPGYLLDVRRSSAGDVVAFTGSTDGGRPLKFVSADNGIFLGAQWTRDIGSGSGIHAWAINGTERARIDSSGRLLVGTSTARSNFGTGTQSARLQIEGTSGDTARIAQVQNANNANGIQYIFAKSRGTTVGSNTIVQSNDNIGTLSFEGSDGTNFVPAAQITGAVDGTPGLNDMPGRLVFSTTADGAASPTERLRIDSLGRVGIGTTSPGYLVTAATSADGVDGVSVESPSLNGVIRLRADGTNGNAIRVGGVGAQGNTLRFLVGSDAERMRIDSSGRLLVGTSSSESSFATNVQIVGTTEAASSQLNLRYSNNADGAFVYLGKSRGATVGTNTIVQANDSLGTIGFYGATGSTYHPGALISAAVDAEPGTAGDATDMPGRLVFSVTADGVSSSTERFRITNDGVRGYNQPAPAAVDTTATLTVANLKTGIITSSTAAAVTMTLPTGTLTEGGFSGLYNNFTFEWTVINTGATNAVTVQGGTDHTLVGSGTVAAGVSGRFASRRTAANTFVTYRLS